MISFFKQKAAEALSEEVHRDVSLSGPEKDDILALPDIGIISAVDPDPDWIWIQWDIPGSVSGSGFAIRIRIQEGKNDPQTKKKVRKISFFEVLDVLF